MRPLLLVFLLCWPAFAAKPDDVIVTQSLVDSINNANLPWKATLHAGSSVEGLTYRQARMLAGVKFRSGVEIHKRNYDSSNITIPTSFDAATNWPKCDTITQIRDQSACGSCWAVAAAESMSDRYCTYGGPHNLSISAIDIVSCCTMCGMGCNGGDPNAAWDFWVSKGLVSSACEPYPFPKCEHHIPQNHYPPCPQTPYLTPPCATHCTANGSQSFLHHFGNNSWSLAGETDFQIELMTHGPFEVAFNVYADFLAYSGGVYVQHSDDYIGGHAVKVVGWGILNGTKYWRIANSWNTDWGLDGYFLIIRGVNECDIESNGSAGSPQL